MTLFTFGRSVSRSAAAYSVIAERMWTWKWDIGKRMSSEWLNVQTTIPQKIGSQTTRGLELVTFHGEQRN